jgi:hypothetical protein
VRADQKEEDVTIRNEKGELVCECDECGQEECGGTEDDFRKFVQSLEDGGWKIRKDGDTWEHFCPDCKEDAL